MRFTFSGRLRSRRALRRPRRATAPTGGTGRMIRAACPTLMPMKFLPSGASGESGAKSTTPTGRHSTSRGRGGR